VEAEPRPPQASQAPQAPQVDMTTRTTDRRDDGKTGSANRPHPPSLRVGGGRDVRHGGTATPRRPNAINQLNKTNTRKRYTRMRGDGSQIVLAVVNVVVLILLAGGLVWLVAEQGCHHQVPPVTSETQQQQVDVRHVLRHIDGLNVITNLLIAVPGVMFLVMGFVLEGSLVLLCSLASCLWHGTGSWAYGVLDQVMASLTAITMLLVFLRICQSRGYPEFSAFYLILPAAAVLMYAAGDARFIANTIDEGEDRRPSPATAYVEQRVAHALWHVLVGAVFMVLAVELLRTPDLLPNRRLASTSHARDSSMRARTWRARGSVGKGPNPTILGGLLADLVRRTKKERDA
jgi:hypothetical protein